MATQRLDDLLRSNHLDDDAVKTALSSYGVERAEDIVEGFFTTEDVDRLGVDLPPVKKRRLVAMIEQLKEEREGATATKKPSQIPKSQPASKKESQNLGQPQKSRKMPAAAEASAPYPPMYGVMPQHMMPPQRYGEVMSQEMYRTAMANWTGSNLRMGESQMGLPNPVLNSSCTSHNQTHSVGSSPQQQRARDFGVPALVHESYARAGHPPMPSTFDWTTGFKFDPNLHRSMRTAPFQPMHTAFMRPETLVTPRYWTEDEHRRFLEGLRLYDKHPSRDNSSDQYIGLATFLLTILDFGWLLHVTDCG